MKNMESRKDTPIDPALLSGGFAFLEKEKPDLCFDFMDSLLRQGRMEIESYDHALRVGMLARMLSERLGLPGEYQELLANAAPLHDIGKMYIPEAILFKPGKLNLMEWVVMTNHTTRGWGLLKDSESRILKMAARICLSHHERWDGYGYPNGISREDIPLPGQIVAVADSFDSIVSCRPYRKAFALEEGISEIKGLKGTQFAPLVVHAFSSLETEIKEYYSSEETMFKDRGVYEHLVS